MTFLPVTRDLSPSCTAALVVAALMAIASLAGLFFQWALYPTEELRRSLLPNDVVNLVIALPILLGAIVLTQRGLLMGLLFLPGALFYGLYNSIAYLIAIPISALSLAYVALIVLAVSALLQVIAGIDANSVQRRLASAVPERLGAGVLIGFGLLFLLRAAGVVFGAHTAASFAVAIADL